MLQSACLQSKVNIAHTSKHRFAAWQFHFDGNFLDKTASHYCSNKILEQTVDLRLQVSFAIAKLPSVLTTAIKGLQRQKGRADCTSQLCTKQYLNQTNRWHVGRSVRRCHRKTDHLTHTHTHADSDAHRFIWYFPLFLLLLHVTLTEMMREEKHVCV